MEMQGLLVEMIPETSKGLKVVEMMEMDQMMGMMLGLLPGMMVWRIGLKELVVQMGQLRLSRGLLLMMHAGGWVPYTTLRDAFIRMKRRKIMGMKIMRW